MNVVRPTSPLRTFLLLASLGAPLALTGVSTAQSSTPAPPPDPREPWTPDRRPVSVIPLFNGSPDNCRALSPGWYQHDDDEIVPSVTDLAAARAALLNVMTSMYADGWRRFIFNLPAGWVCGNAAFPGNQWTALPEWKKYLISTAIPEWLASHPAATVGVYTGLICSTNLDSLCVEAETACSPNLPACETCDSPGQQFVSYSLTGSGFVPFMANSLPWAACGHTELFIDLAATIPAELVSWFFAPPFHGVIRIGGEAIPLLGSPGSTIAHPAYIDRAPWVALSNGFVVPNLGGPYGPSNHYDPERTEVGLILDYAPLVPGEMIGGGGSLPYTMPIGAMRGIVERGWVPWTGPAFGEPAINTRNELLKRIYGFGIIAVADFNYDGVINPDDLSEFITAYFLHTATRGNFVHGDVNGDTYINSDDLDEFLDAFFNPVPTTFDFGGPNPEYAMIP